ncbi:sensor domain-containing protein [Embleya scabrispora]|nr:sensor domain-containing protein [Embleya scabrispora]
MSTTMPRRAATTVVVPLTALALFGLTACEKSGGDAKDKSPASASTSADSGKGDKNATPATDRQLSAVLIDGKDIPAGYGGGKVSNERSPDKPGRVVSPAECVALGSGGTSHPVGHAERSYAIAPADPESDDSVRVSLSSAPREVLQKQLDDGIKALSSCAHYTYTENGDVTTFAVTDVKVGVRGKDSVSYKVAVSGKGRLLGTAVNTLVLQGTTGLAVTSFATPGKGDPADTGPFVSAQLARLDKMPPDTGSSPSKPARPTADSRTIPAADTLTAALLNAQEIPAEYSADGPEPATPEDAPRLSDPRCAPLLDTSLDQRTAAIQQKYRKTTLDATVQPTEGVITELSSSQHAVLKREFDAYVAALKVCSSFSETNEDGTVDRYTITDVAVGRHGADTVAFRMRDDHPTDGRLYAYLVVAVKGDVAMQMASFAQAGPAEVPSAMITGQLSKVAEIAG